MHFVLLAQVCKSLVGMGLKVAAINRSSAPREKEDWIKGVDYIAADVFEPEVSADNASTCFHCQLEGEYNCNVNACMYAHV